MSDTVTIKNGKSIYSGKVVLTSYGRKRILERISEGANFVPYNFTHIGIGDFMNTTYGQNVDILGDEVIVIEISDKNVTLKDNIATIETNIDIDTSIAIQEIGLYETINNSRKLFAYASGFSIIKGPNISYGLTIDLSISLAFENEHYSRLNIRLDDSEYALAPEMSNMFRVLSVSQLDLERSIDINARELGYNKAQAFMLEQQNIGDILRNILLLGRYQKIISRIGQDSITDCFFYPETSESVYTIKNLKDVVTNKYIDNKSNVYTLVGNKVISSTGEQFNAIFEDDKLYFYNSSNVKISLSKLPESVMKIKGDLQICNRDNVDLSHAASISYTGKLGSMTRSNIIFGKINPVEDEYYFDFRVIYNDDRAEYGLQFTIYCYDKDSAKRNNYTDERKLVGHYRVTYFPTSREKVVLSNSENIITFVYNGNIESPEVKMYLNNTLLNSSTNFIVDNFNYMGPCHYFKDTCTLRNYSQTNNSSTFKKPMYYLLPDVETSSIVVFNKELSESEINYLSFISKG